MIGTPISLLAASLMLALPGWPQTTDPGKEEIETDRLEVSGLTVPKGSLQVENGMEWTRQAGDWTLDGFQTGLRLGVDDRTEIQAGVPDYYVALGSHTTASGFGDFSLGMKQQLFPTDSTIQIAVNPGVSFPTGSASRSDHSTNPILQVPISVEPDDFWSFGFVLASSYPTINGRRVYEGGSELFVDRMIGKRFDAFIEHVGEYPRRGSPIHSLEFGGAYRIASTQEVDAFMEFGLSSAAPGIFVGVGY